MEYLDTQTLEFKCLVYILEDTDLLFFRQKITCIRTFMKTEEQ